MNRKTASQIDKAFHYCGSCWFYQTHKPEMKHQSTNDQRYKNWCSALRQATEPQLFRCGGDQYEFDNDVKHTLHK